MFRFINPIPYLSLLPLLSGGALFSQAAGPDLTVPLTFETALHWAIEADPLLRRADVEADAAEGQIEQADLAPNPVVIGEAENFLGTGPYSGVDAIEVTLGISQLIETAGKREKRTDLARRERDSVDWMREQRLAEIEADIRLAFVGVLLAQESVELRREQLELAGRSEVETARLVELARAPQVELTRARLAVQQQRFALQQAENARNAARIRLAIRCGFSSDGEYRVEGAVVVEEAVPDLDALIVLLPSTAALARFDSIEAIGKAAIDLEEAKARPDLEVLAGGRYFNEREGQIALVAGISIPWPMFDQNQGNIRTARARLRAVEYQREAVRREVLTALAAAHQSLTAAHQEAMSIEENLIPGARQTLADVETGYERGQFNLLMVLESRLTLFTVREAYLDAVSRYAFAHATIQSLLRPAAVDR